MKNIFSNKQIKSSVALILIFSIAMLASCKKSSSDGDTQPTVTDKGSLSFHLHTYIDNNEVDLYNITYTALDGRNMSLSMAQLYISDIQAVKSDGSVYSFSDKKILKELDKDTYSIGELPVGNYKAIRFKVGLDAATNALDPSSNATLLNRSEMWFGSTAQPDGYVFMNVQGKIDTTSSLSGTLVPFTFKIGTNIHYVQVNLPERNFRIEKGQVYFGHIIIDYYKLFNGIQLDQLSSSSVATSADNSTPVASLIANNIASMFIFE